MCRATRRRSAVAALTLLVATVGCSSLTLEQAAFTYYRHGPAAALSFHSWLEVAPAYQLIADREWAMASLELGFYRAVLDDLEPEAVALARVGGLDPATVRSSRGVFLGEAYERVMVPTLGVAAALALQDGAEAADWADLALATARQLDPAPSGAPTAWTLAALAYEAAGRLGAAQTISYELAARGGPELAAVAAHLAAPALGQRSLVVLFLLGVGPSKSVGSLTLPGGERVAWPLYDPAREPARGGARVRLDGEAAVAALTVEELWATARRDLKRRRDRLLAGATAATFAGERETTGWRSLPATVQLVRVAVPEDAQECTMEVVDARGDLVWDESFALPAWADGPLFVVRRVP